MVKRQNARPANFIALCYQDDVVTANVTVFTLGDPYRLNYGLPSPPNASNLLLFGSRMYAYTALHFASLARTLFGAARVGRADTPGVRVVPVIGALASCATDGETKLEWLNNAWGPPADAGLATMNIGGYWSASRNVSSDPAVTVDEVMESLLANIAADSTLSPTAFTSAFAGFTAIGAYYGIAMHAYEGGPDTSGGKGAGVAERDGRLPGRAGTLDAPPAQRVGRLPHDRARRPVCVRRRRVVVPRRVADERPPQEADDAAALELRDGRLCDRLRVRADRKAGLQHAQARNAAAAAAAAA